MSRTTEQVPPAHRATVAGASDSHERRTREKTSVPGKRPPRGLSASSAVDFSVVELETQVRKFVHRRLRTEVDDAVQETLTRGFAGRHRFEHRSSFRSYMLGIARRVISAEYRRQRRNHPLSDPDEEIAVDVVPHEQRLALTHDVVRLREGMGELSEKLSVCLRLYYWDCLSAPEIAERLGIPEGTVRSRLRRGCLRLRETIEA